MLRVRLKSGTYRRGEKKYVAGDHIEFESEFDIPDGFRNMFEIPIQKPDVGISSLTIKHKGAGRYNVINLATGEPINDELLTREEAYSFIGEPIPETEETEPIKEVETEQVEPVEEVEAEKEE